jgi:hypothetical protein
LADRRAQLIQERNDIEVTQAEVRAADALVSQAIVFALDGEAGTADFASVDQARSVAADAVVPLTALDTSSTDFQGALRLFRNEALSITQELAAGKTEAARLEYSDELNSARGAFEGIVDVAISRIDSELVELDGTVAWVSMVASVAAGVSVVGVVVLALAVARLRRSTPGDDEISLAVHDPVPLRRVENRPHVVIQLPTGPNTLARRRRYPRVEDLGWLIGEVMKPYRARGWEASFRCPLVGADCDPADIREILNSLLSRADSAAADRIGIVVRPTESRVQVVVADDGESIFGPDSYLSASEPVRLRSSVRTRTEADTAELTWSRFEHLNVAILDLPRLGIVLPIGANA